MSQYHQPQKLATDKKNIMASPTPTVDATLNIGGPSLFDANMTNSIDTAFSSLMFLSDKKQPGGTGSFNPLQSELDDSLAYSKGAKSQNTTAQKMNATFTPPPKDQQNRDLSPSDISVKAKSRYQPEPESHFHAIQSGTMTLNQLNHEDLRNSEYNPFRKSVTMAVGSELKKLNQDKSFQNQVKAIQSDTTPEQYASNASAMSFAAREKRSSSLSNKVNIIFLYLIH